MAVKLLVEIIPMNVWGAAKGYLYRASAVGKKPRAMVDERERNVPQAVGDAEVSYSREAAGRVMDDGRWRTVGTRLVISYQQSAMSEQSPQR